MQESGSRSGREGDWCVQLGTILPDEDELPYLTKMNWQLDKAVIVEQVEGKISTIVQAIHSSLAQGYLNH